MGARKYDGAVLHKTLITLALLAGLTEAIRGATINGTISGTCGFYQTSRSNVVFSETFSGPADGTGTYCTDFQPGGALTPGLTLQVGDVFANADHSTVGTAPAGFGIFTDFDVTLQVTQAYVITASSLSIPPQTATGTVRGFFDSAGGTDDGSAAGGSCMTLSGLVVAGHDSAVGGSSQFTFPITFGQPFTATETSRVVCHIFGPRFGDSGTRDTIFEGLVSDADGKVLGSAAPVAVPEPATAVLMVFAGVVVEVRVLKRIG
jgi:hypothetical protein